MADKLRRACWSLVWLALYRPSPVPLHGWRRVLLRAFGARVGEGAHPYPSARIWAPRNLVMEAGSCLASEVDCYNVAVVRVGEGAIVSQKTYLCAASHDFRDASFPLVTAPIEIGAGAWVAAGAFVGPGVTVGARAVVGACAVVMKSVAPGAVVAGNPAKSVGRRDAPAEDGAR